MAWYIHENVTDSIEEGNQTRGTLLPTVSICVVQVSGISYGLPVVTASPLSGKCLHHWQNYTTKPYVKWNWLHWQNHREQKGERESGKFSRKEKLLVGHVCVCCLKPHGAAQNAPLVSNNVGNNCSCSWYTTCLSSIHFHCSLWFIFSTVKLSTDYVKEEVDLPGGNAKIPDEKIMKKAIISHCIYMNSTLIYQNKLTHGLLTV